MISEKVQEYILDAFAKTHNRHFIIIIAVNIITVWCLWYLAIFLLSPSTYYNTTFFIQFIFSFVLTVGWLYISIIDDITTDISNIITTAFISSLMAVFRLGLMLALYSSFDRFFLLPLGLDKTVHSIVGIQFRIFAFGLYLIYGIQALYRFYKRSRIN